jgi:hypothetical protein
LTGLVSHFANRTFDSIARPFDSIARPCDGPTTNGRCFACQISGLVHRLLGACPKIVEHALALIELALNTCLCLRGEVAHRVTDLCCRIAHATLNFSPIHKTSSLPMLAFYRQILKHRMR